MTGFPHGILFILFFILLILIRNAHKNIGFQTRKSVKLLGSGCRNIGKKCIAQRSNNFILRQAVFFSVFLCYVKKLLNFVFYIKQLN